MKSEEKRNDLPEKIYFLCLKAYQLSRVINTKVIRVEEQ